MNYNIVLYGKTNNLNNIFQSGTTSGSSGFKQTNADFNTFYASYTSGYKTYFTQEFLGNTTTIPPFPFQVAGVSMGTLYNFKTSLFFTATGNDTSLTHSNTTGFNYSLRYIASGGTINFKTDTIAYVCLVGGGGGGGRNNNSTPRGAGGGGGGSLNTMYFPMKNNITYSFTIGGGGSGSVTSGTRGGNGVATSMSWTMNATSYTISARGGGGGGAGGSAAHAGGSGGGACASAAAGSANSTPGVTNGPISYSYANNIISGQGTSGIPTIGSFSGTFTNGSSANVGSYAFGGGTATQNGGGGGGGAGEAGTGSAGAPGGKGGDGLSILGVATVGGGGGGGSGSGSSTGGAGGSGGGGRGSNNTEGGVAGTANTGGGGGGSDNAGGNGGVGGSGVVYVFF